HRVLFGRIRSRSGSLACRCPTDIDRLLSPTRLAAPGNKSVRVSYPNVAGSEKCWPERDPYPRIPTNPDRVVAGLFHRRYAGPLRAIALRLPAGGRRPK